MFGPDSLFAHRGLHDDANPRNSLAAITAAVDAGYGVEIDVRLSADGEPVISHDPDTLHDTGEFHIVESTSAAVLSSLQFTGTEHSLATLDDVLRNVAPTVPLLIEIKPTRRVREIVDAVTRRCAGREHSVAIQSFHPSIVRAAKNRGFPVGQLVEQETADMGMVRRLQSRTVASNVIVRPDFIAVELPLLTSRAVEYWRRRLPLLAWTVTSQSDVDACRRAGAGMIFEGVRPSSTRQESLE